jgi:hypothetical protein
MIKLRDIQDEITNAVWGRHALSPKIGICENGVPRDKRFAIYKNTIYVSLINSLRSSFPLTASLLGNNNFKILARDYITAYPPTIPHLIEYGDGLATFIRHYAKIQDDAPSLSQIAHCEYLMNIAYIADNSIPLSAHDLTNLSEESLLSTRLKIRKSTFVSPPLNDYSYHLLLAHKYGTIGDNALSSPPPALPHDGGTQDDNNNNDNYILIVKTGLSVTIHPFSHAGKIFLSHLIDGLALANATEKILTSFPDINFQELFAHCLTYGCFEKINGNNNEKE